MPLIYFHETTSKTASKILPVDRAIFSHKTLFFHILDISLVKPLVMHLMLILVFIYDLLVNCFPVMLFSNEPVLTCLRTVKWLRSLLVSYPRHSLGWGVLLLCRSIVWIFFCLIQKDAVWQNRFLHFLFYSCQNGRLCQENVCVIHLSTVWFAWINWTIFSIS